MPAIGLFVSSRTTNGGPCGQSTQPKRHLAVDGHWAHDDRLWVALDHIIIQHGGRTFEGRLTFQELIRRLRRIGYFEAKGISSDDPFEEFEQAIGKLVDSGPSAVYYAVDRKSYLDKLKSVYEKKREK